MRRLPGADTLRCEQEVLIALHIRRYVDDAGGADEFARRDRVGRVLR